MITTNGLKKPAVGEQQADRRKRPLSAPRRLGTTTGTVAATEMAATEMAGEEEEVAEVLVVRMVFPVLR